MKANKENHLEMFISVPQGMIVPNVKLKQLGVQGSDKPALRIQKSLHGLKQPVRLWRKLLDTRPVEYGFVRSVSDACLYFNHDKGKLTIAWVYVDDLLVTASIQGKVEIFEAASVLSIKE